MFYVLNSCVQETETVHAQLPDDGSYSTEAGSMLVRWLFSQYQWLA